MNPVGVLQQDAIETALIHLLSMRQETPNTAELGLREGVFARMDASKRNAVGSARWEGLRLRVPVLEPWFCGWNPLEEERAFVAVHHDLVSCPMVEALGPRVAAAFPSVPQSVIQHVGRMFMLNGLWQMPRLPKGYRGMVKGAQFYGGLQHGITEDGQEIYIQSLHGWDPKRNQYVPVVTPFHGLAWKDAMVGTWERGYWQESREVMSVLASVALDAQERWQVRVEDSAAVWLASDAEGIHHLADLRDDPLSVSGRRRPFLHWVKEHLRRRAGSNDLISVQKHLRGITHFPLGSLQIQIHEPQKKTP